MRIIKAKNGFTLLELMITVSLAGFLLYLGLTQFSKEIQQQSLNGATQQLALAIKQARYYAKAKGVITNLNLQTGKNTYSIVADGETVTNNSNYDATSGVLPDNVQILSNSCNNIYFYVDGTPVDSSNKPIGNRCKIEIGNNTQKSTLYIDAGSGSVNYE